jgi:hypothetical protein
MNWWKVVLYVGAGLSGAAAALFPVAAPILTPVATGLAGLATQTPGTKPIATTERK